MSTDPKRRGSAPKKRKPPRNRFVQAKKRRDMSVEHVQTETVVGVFETGCSGDASKVGASDSTGTKSATPTRSDIKIHNLYNILDEPESDKEVSDTSDSDCSDTDSEECVNIGHKYLGNRIIDFEILSQNISKQLLCRFCHSDVSLIEISRRGLGSELAFHCSNKRCKKGESFFSCEMISTGNLPPVCSINRRATLAMRCIGCDHADLCTLCGVMNLPPPVSKNTHKHINNSVKKAAMKVMDDSMITAGKQEYALAAPTDDACRNIDVSGDGTWLTPGHSSMVGAATVIGMNTGKVVGAGTKSKVCKSCQYWEKQDKNCDKYRCWKARHADHCTKNHAGSSGSMEKEIIKDIFCSSVEKHQLRYTRYIGDGDTNSFKALEEAKPYGDVGIEKIECVGHIQKRMGTRLRNLKKTMGNRKLADGKPIGGKGRLTNLKIDKIQQFYGNAIRGNKNDLVAMRAAVWAVYFHYSATNEEPTHNFCGDWCPYKRAVANGTAKHFRHTSNLPKAVLEHVKPIFKDLAATDLLKKCLEGYSQNANESINSVIWKFCPKKGNHGLVTVDIAVALAVATFNSGATAIGMVMKEMGLTVGKSALDFFASKDRARILNSQRQAKMATYEVRQARRRRRLHLDEVQEEEEGFPYLAGGH